MTGQDEQKRQSLDILQLILNTVLKENDSSYPHLLQAISQITNDRTPYPVSDKDWELFFQNIELNFSRQQYKKILSFFPPEHQKIAENARKKALIKLRG